MAETGEWWKNAVIYGVDVERFCDGNGDGIGDFAGLTDRLDHLARLGVTCIWLLPFHPSTNRDNGYDITDYLQVDPRYGTFDDFLAFVTGAGARGIRVILDLVAQHTSDRHPWFLSARHDARRGQPGTDGPGRLPRHHGCPWPGRRHAHLRARPAPPPGGDARGRWAKVAPCLQPAVRHAWRPLICYGDEIGMGEDLSQKGRNAVRSPMQWTKGRNGGFSTAPKAQLAQALVTCDFGPGAVNAEDQWADDGSLLNLVARLAAIRLAHPGIGRRECRPIGDAPDSVIALRYAAADHDLVVIHNLSAKPAPLDLDLGASCRGEGSVLLGDPLSTDDGHLQVTLPTYDFRWSKWPR